MPTVDIDIIEAKKIYDTNFWGALAVIQAFALMVIEVKGTTVNNCSISGHLNVPFMGLFTNFHFLPHSPMHILGLYSASKISLEMLSEALRLEMAPFHVKVAEIVTGAVQSNGQTYFTDIKLPSESRFLPIEDTIVNRAQGGDGHARMATDKYAEDVVDDILRGATGRIWHGNNAASTKAAVTGPVPQEKMVSFCHSFHFLGSYYSSSTNTVY
jgi:NAD(P)-dependent dehydrogenase (short-subunit alcohol dehydrogenase family)